MLEPGRQYSAGTGYRYGFNGKENDTEDPVQYDYGFRIYDPRLGRFKSVDPIAKSYPWNSPYAFAENEPISNIDIDGLEKYKVTIRTFLPYTYVWEPQSEDIIDKANTRWYPQYRNVETHGGYKTEQQFEVDFYSSVVKYSPSPIPSTLQKDLTTGEISNYENRGLGSTETIMTIFENRANIYADIASQNPATPWWLPTPAIDYGLSISVMKDGTYLLKGKWDGFPALEIFLEDVETGQTDLIYFNNTSDAGKDLNNRTNPKEITNLFPIIGDVKINKIGQLGDSPQVDKTTPSSKVAENNNRFSKKDCKCGPEASPPREKITAGNITEF